MARSQRKTKKLECGVVRRQAGLRGEPDRRVGRAIAAIAATLDDLEEKALVVGLGIDLQVFRVALAVVQDVMRLQQFELIGGQVCLGQKVVVIVFRNGEQAHTVLLQVLHGRDKVVGGEGNVLHA